METAWRGKDVGLCFVSRANFVVKRGDRGEMSRNRREICLAKDTVVYGNMIRVGCIDGAAPRKVTREGMLNMGWIWR